jgi:ankyrin repeat protein
MTHLCADLNFASDLGHSECLQKLLPQKVIDINKKDFDGYNPLHRAAIDGHLNCINLLLEAGANVHEKSFQGNTALHYASLHGWSECVTTLLRYKADVNEINNNGWTALHKASWRGCRNCIVILLDHGADPNQKNNKGQMPCDCARNDDIKNLIETYNSDPIKEPVE